jgi:O-methyltransferase
MIKLKLRTKAKRIISRLSRDSSRARYIAYLGRFEKWRTSRKEPYPVFEDRYKLYDYLNQQVINEEPITYLEFGVSKGESLKYWVELNQNKTSRFWGFDTFFGLPDTWEVFTGKVEKNAFSMDGKPPAIADDRIAFVQGLFQETLPEFLQTFERRGRLILHNDADLYSSTLYVLSRCDDILAPGTIVMFDEFSSVLHEFRAWEDYCSAYRKEYTVIAATNGPYDYFSQVAIEIR